GIYQVRLLRRTSLLEALEAKPSLTNDQKRRLRELRETFKIGAQGQPAPPAAPPPPPPPAVEEPAVQAPTTELEALVTYLSDEEREQAEKVSTVQKIYRMNTAEQLLAATQGTRGGRALPV